MTVNIRKTHRCIPKLLVCNSSIFNIAILIMKRYPIDFSVEQLVGLDIMYALMAEGQSYSPLVAWM